MSTGNGAPASAPTISRQPQPTIQLDQAGNRLAATAKILGQFRRDLRAEGFNEKQAFELVQYAGNDLIYRTLKDAAGGAA